MSLGLSGSTNKIVLILLIIAMLVCITGCKNKKDPLTKLSKDELVEIINGQLEDLNDKDEEIKELKDGLKGVQTENGPTSAIISIGDGKGRTTFNSVDGKIIFPKPFEYPGSTQAPNTSSVNITSTLSIIPTNNWITVLDGTTLELEHVNGTKGIIRAGQIKQAYNREELQKEVMNEFFSELPPSDVIYKKLFLNDQWWGIEGLTSTTINENKAYIRCGMLGLGEQSFVYMFLYDGEKDSGKDEIIISLLRTIKMFGQQLRLE